MKRVLMIAAQYPPMKGSSGLQRVLKFSEYLPEFGWQPIVLTPADIAHEQLSHEQVGEIPETAIVHKAWALDAKRHLSIMGRYPSFVALPDRWVSWWLGAVPAGVRLVRKYRPDAIWSTYPIATAHMIGNSLARRTGLPWVADFRDSMTEPGFPEDAAIRNSRLKIECKAVTNAARVVFTAPSARTMYAERYPDVPDSRWAVVANGFDEENFRCAEAELASLPAGKKVLLHSGLIDPGDRDPSAFFEALARLKAGGDVSADALEIRLRATGFNTRYRETTERLGIADIVKICETIPYAEALREMLTADGLVLFQGANCNHQIPAKAYEYFRAGRPVLGLADPAGDTGRLLVTAGVQHVVALDDAAALHDVIRDFIDDLAADRVRGVDLSIAEGYSRRNLTKNLASLLDDVSQKDP